MSVRQPSSFVLLLAAGALGLVGCEPYLSMTDQIPAQTRRAATLLPETPRYVGMVDIETALRRFEDLRGQSLSDSLRQTNVPPVRTFLDATGLDLETDVQAVYGAGGKEQVSGAVLFAALTPEQVDRYMEARPGGGGQATTYRGAPLYHLTFGAGASGAGASGAGDAAPPDTLSVAFVEKGMLAVGTDPGRVTAMVDRHRAEGTAGLRANEDYMRLVERVGHGSTAWLAGRNVVETALRDSTAGKQSPSGGASPVSQAGMQRVLTEWTDRMLGLSEVNVSSFEGAGSEVSRLKKKLREQAVSITLTDAALRGEAYLTMDDDASASSVVDVAEGAVAVAKLSKEDLNDRQRDLLDEITVDRTGAVVRVQFSLDPDRLRRTEGGGRRTAAGRSAGSYEKTVPADGGPSGLPRPAEGAL